MEEVTDDDTAGPTARPGPRIVFFGTCQMRASWVCYRRFAMPHMGGQAFYVQPGKLNPAERAALENADIVVEQIMPMKGNVTPPVVPEGAQHIRVPMVDGTFHWPFSGTMHPDNETKYDNYGPFSSEMGDSWLVAKLRAGVSPEQAAADYLNLDIAKVGRLDRRMEMALEMQADREAPTPFRFAPIIEQKFRTEKLFKTPYHLEWRLTQYLMLTLLQEIGAPEAVLHAVRTYLVRSPFVSHEQPVHPATIAHFGLTWANADSRFCFWSEAVLTFQGFVERFVNCEAYPQVPRAVQAVFDKKPEAETLIRDALRLVPDSPWALQAAGLLQQRQGHTETALDLFDRALAVWPGMSRAHMDRFEVLSTLGRAEEADAAITAAVAAEPYNAIWQLRMAGHSIQTNHPERARAALEATLALKPNSKRAHVLTNKLNHTVARAKLGAPVPKAIQERRRARRAARMAAAQGQG